MGLNPQTSSSHQESCWGLGCLHQLVHTGWGVGGIIHAVQISAVNPLASRRPRSAHTVNFFVFVRCEPLQTDMVWIQVSNIERVAGKIPCVVLLLLDRSKRLSLGLICRIIFSLPVSQQVNKMSVSQRLI